MNLGQAVVLLVAYVALRIPLVTTPIPGWYHSAVQYYTFGIAINTANYVIPPTTTFYPSAAGASLHGILAAPIIKFGLDPGLVRVELVLVGIITVIFLVLLLEIQGISRDQTFPVILGIIVTPHFVIFSGFALPQGLTIMFGVASLYFYLRFIQCPSNSRFGLLSGGLAGLAALNRYWGGIVTVTIFAIEFVTLLAISQSGREFDVRGELSERYPIFAYHLLGLVPAILHYLSTHSPGSAGHYSKYTLAESWPLLFQLEWYKTMGFYTAEYQPYSC